jgi:rare lipoprotein A
MSIIKRPEETKRATPFGSRRRIQLFAGFLLSLALAACAQSPSVTSKSELLSRQASLAGNPRLNKSATLVPMRGRHPTEANASSVGVASFYSEGTKTASGEAFNPQELTAAHPSLPFGTRLRVTNLSTGRSVVVRVNDRGPFVPGRVVDVSYSAAASLGMIERGTAKVKLDVIQ